MQWLTAGWRLATPDGFGSDGVPKPTIQPEPGKSLFETIEQSSLPDETTFIVHRTERSFVVLNVYPYSAGHVMVLPRRAVPSMLGLTSEEHDDLWSLVRQTYAAVNAAFEPEGMNLGINDGIAGGASQPDHLHVHIVPRWAADTSFMTSTADVRVLPMTLRDAWLRVRAAWPEPLASTR